MILSGIIGVIPAALLMILVGAGMAIGVVLAIYRYSGRSGAADYGRCDLRLLGLLQGKEGKLGTGPGH